MREINKKINELITQLDIEKDYLLINLLILKRREISNEYLKKHYITKYEFGRSKDFIHKVLYNSLKTSNFRLQKINEIENRSFDCRNCRISIDSPFTSYDGSLHSYKTNNQESEVCKSCLKRCEILDNERNCEMNIMRIKADNILNNPKYKQLFILKAMIDKAGNLTSKIKKCKNEAS